MSYLNNLIILIIFNFNVINGDLKIFDKKLWPPMQDIDIWSANSIEIDKTIKNQFLNVTEILTKPNDYNNKLFTYNNKTNLNNINLVRQSKVLNFFPVPVDDECLSDDERRYGICFNPYECRNRGGQAKGECALGFGVCCVFVTSCDQEIKNNITYLISPNFPSFMPNNLTNCKVKIKLMNSDISQLRIDFHHFLLGQPNRTNGNCDGDVFQISKGTDRVFKICGQNSGQHVYYDIDRMLSMEPLKKDLPIKNSSIDLANNTLNQNINESQIPMNETNQNGGDDDFIDILINFSSRVIQTRFWEIRIMQIPFGQRAPAGCLQYFTGSEGTIQTFNFADNGRHLSQQNYKACIQQHQNVCSIAYEPCGEHSFRIGPSDIHMDDDQTNQLTNLINENNATTTAEILNDHATEQITSTAVPLTTPLASLNVASSPPTQQADDTIEGSGGDDENSNIQLDSPSSTPVRGGFDILSFFRSTFFNFRSMRSSNVWKSRQYFPRCRDRITMPCIVEDFIIPDPLDPANSKYGFPNCQPVHCGNSFCPQGMENCRIESTVTPFYLGIHFGEGVGKGSPEDNIGACLKYKQLQCL